MCFFVFLTLPPVFFYQTKAAAEMFCVKRCDVATVKLELCVGDLVLTLVLEVNVSG